MTSGDAVSPDELRSRLYQTFKNRGLLDTLKTQLRNQLIQELKHPVLSGEVRPHSPSVEGDSLLFQASNSLVVDHLRRSGYEYSLSVFYPECGLEKEKIFTTRDLLQLMKINPRSKLYQSLTSVLHSESRKGFLMQLLIELTEHHLHKEERDAETQTSSAPQYGESIAEKLQLVDEQFAMLQPKRHKWESSEAKLAEYRKQIQEELQAETDQKLQYFKDSELAKLKMEEREKSRKEISELQHKLERTYQAKSEALVTREKNAVERLQKQQEIEEKEIYVQRQGLLKDIETLRNRELELKQRIESCEIAQKLQEEKNNSREEVLRRRELAVKTIEDTYEQKLKNELLRYQLELKEEYLKRTEKVTEDEKKNRAEAHQLREEFIIINSRKEELQQATAQVKQLELEVNSVKAQVSLVTGENELLTEKLKEAADYPLLKRQNLELQAQIQLLEKQLEDAQEENRHLRARFSQPTSEYVALQAELKRAENAKRMAQEERENHKQVLERQLQNEVERCGQLKAQLLGCEDTCRRLTGQVEDLKLQLQHTQLALESEVYRNPKPSLVDRSVLDLTADKVVPPNIYIDTALLRRQALPADSLLDLIGVTSTSYQRPAKAHCFSPDSDVDLVAESKARIKELEKEAENLEEAYRNYQQRAIQAAVAGSSNARVLSPLPPPHSSRGILARVPSPSQCRVTFAEDLPRSQRLLLDSVRDYRYTGLNLHLTGVTGDTTPTRRSISPPSHLSSTPLSRTGREFSNRITSEDRDGSFLTSSRHSSKHRSSPSPRRGHCSSAMTDAEKYSFTQSDDSEKCSGKSQPVDLPEGDMSTQPEKVGFEDVAGYGFLGVEDQEDIPEQLEGDVSHKSGDSVNGIHVSHPVPVTATSQQEQPVSQHLDEEQKRREANDEVRRWEAEQKKREEKRQRERQEAWEREQRELERLEEEKRLGEELPGKEATREDASVVKEADASKDEAVAAGLGASPLEKYMKMIQQHKEQDKNSRKEAMEESSLLERISNEKDDR
ncbi:centriole and centriolar satellite protein ofd1 isoform X3 [Latimeria chalumnae]|uniref:centriole and centriolar satellite protein ofd1 isoform X3 n=1 Tax=Latimeria chalumnae TaxID=7897 RepID=UPI0006D900B1|nr:PREDICTED: oral-facial-digital syndrome 1 protein isoform X3 [Latimeria chalumnae]|eukprot:XP_014343950.1 PREDICTED: oral-facial-digital syndrome 1 protein isoform X3 [Latimeria chalumnae]